MNDFAQAILAVGILLKKDEKILLHRRAGGIYASGNYDIPGGHVDEGELILAAAAREAKEELGVDIDAQDLTLFHVIERPNGDDDKYRVNFGFVCERWKGTPKIMEPDKCDELLWAKIDDLPSRTVPWTVQVLEGYQKQILFFDILIATNLTRRA